MYGREIEEGTATALSMKKPPILLCFVVITSLFQPHSAIEEVQCTGVEDSGVCGKGALKVVESVSSAIYLALYNVTVTCHVLK